MYNIKLLTIADWAAYRDLMFRWIFPQLAGLYARDRLLMVGVETAGYPIGLAVLELEWEERSARVHCLFVREGYRRKGLASCLLDEIRRYCNTIQIHTIQIAYYTGKSATGAIEAWLHKRNWTEPRQAAVVFHIDRSIAAAAWLRDRQLPPDLRLLLWDHIDRKNRDRLAAGQGPSFPRFLSPFKSFASQEACNSLGIVSASGIEGWSITYRVAEDTVLYDAVFISPQYRQFGLALMMLSESIRLQLAADIAYGMFAVNANSPAMMRIARQWLAPYAYRINEQRMSSLQL